MPCPTLPQNNQRVHPGDWDILKQEPGRFCRVLLAGNPKGYTSFLPASYSSWDANLPVANSRIYTPGNNQRQLFLSLEALAQCGHGLSISVLSTLAHSFRESVQLKMIQKNLKGSSLSATTTPPHPPGLCGFTAFRRRVHDVTLRSSTLCWDRFTRKILAHRFHARGGRRKARTAHASHKALASSTRRSHKPAMVVSTSTQFAHLLVGYLIM